MKAHCLNGLLNMDHVTHHGALNLLLLLLLPLLTQLLLLLLGDSRRIGRMPVAVVVDDVLGPEVDGVVLPEVVRAAEGLAADAADVGPVAGVDPLVAPQVLRPQEGPLAPGELALEPPPLHHHGSAVNHDGHGRGHGRASRAR